MNLSTENKYEALKQSFLASPLFDVIKVGDHSLIATRHRSLVPGRGVFRLLIPHVRVVVSANKEQGTAISVRPDPLALFMGIMLFGSILTEFLLDRSLYPRDYPPEFIYGLAIFYIGLLMIEFFYSRKQICMLLDQIKP